MSTREEWTRADIAELDRIDAADLLAIPSDQLDDTNPDDEDGYLDAGADGPDLLELLAEQDRKWATRVVEIFAERVRRHPGIRIPELAIIARGDMEQERIPIRRPAAALQLAADALGGRGAFAPAEPELSSFIVSVEEYTAAVPAVIPWVCNPIAYSGGVSMFAGPAKGGKSTLSADLQRCRETGERFLGAWDVAKGPTLLVTEEGGVAVVYKTEGLHELDILDRRTALEGELTFSQVLELIGRWSEGHPGGLVFIDTLSIWAGIEDENDAAKVTAALGAVMALAQRTGLALILVHHTRKGGGEHGEAIRGSGAMLGTVDIGIELTYTGDERYPDERYLTVQGRVILPERCRLSFDRLTKTYSMADMEARAESETDADLAGVPADGPGLTRDDLHNVWGKDPRKLLERYLRAGRLRVERVKDGRVHVLRYWKLPARSLWTDES